MSCNQFEPKGTALITLQRHLPTGVAWDAYRIVGKNLYRLWSAFARAYDDMSAALCRLVTELNPYTTEHMIEEWERAVGLPDPCLPTANTLAERRGLVLFRLAKRRWTTSAEWVELASLFGLQIKITPGWYVQRKALFGDSTHGFSVYQFPLSFDIFPKLGRFRVYIDVTNQGFDGFEYGDGLHTGFPIPFNDTLPGLNAFMCLIDRLRPANVVVIWNQFPMGRT
jgi:uncharacterized protein YmfQ (DUF2313 family)